MEDGGRCAAGRQVFPALISAALSGLVALLFLNRGLLPLRGIAPGCCLSAPPGREWNSATGTNQAHFVPGTNSPCLPLHGSITFTLNITVTLGENGAYYRFGDIGFGCRMREVRIPDYPQSGDQASKVK